MKKQLGQQIAFFSSILAISNLSLSFGLDAVSWEFNYLLNWPFLPLSLFILRKGNPIRKHFLLIGKDGMSLVNGRTSLWLHLQLVYSSLSLV